MTLVAMDLTTVDGCEAIRPIGKPGEHATHSNARDAETFSCQTFGVPPLIPHENPIHSAGARQMGFREGLVVGATQYGWLTHMAVAALGQEWIERGSFSVSFVRPLYYRQPATLTAQRAGVGGRSLSVRTRSEEFGPDPLAICTFSADAREQGTLLSRSRLPERELPVLAARPIASPETIRVGDTLGVVELCMDTSLATAHLHKSGQSWPAYFAADAPYFAGLYVTLGNWIFELNYLANPWMHLKSHGRHVGRSRVGDKLSIRGVVKRSVQQPGRTLLELELQILANDTQPVAELRHIVGYGFA